MAVKLARACAVQGMQAERRGRLHGRGVRGSVRGARRFMSPLRQGGYSSHAGLCSAAGARRHHLVSNTHAPPWRVQPLKERESGGSPSRWTAARSERSPLLLCYPLWSDRPELLPASGSSRFPDTEIPFEPRHLATRAIGTSAVVPHDV